MEIDVLAYFMLVAQKRKWRIALVTALSLVGLTAVARYIPTQYEATIKVFSNPDQPSLTPNIMPSISFGSDKQDIYISYQESLLRSQPVFEKVQKALSKDAPPAKTADEGEDKAAGEGSDLITRTIWTIQELLFGADYVKIRRQLRSNEFNNFRGRIGVSRDGENGNIIIGYTDGDAERALATAKALAQGLIELNLEIASNHAAKTAEFLSENMKEIDGQIRSSGQTFERFVTENNYLGSGELIDKRLASYFDEQRMVSESKLDFIRSNLTLKTSTSLRDSLKERLQKAKADTSKIEAEAIAAELRAYENSLILQKQGSGNKKDNPILTRLTQLKDELERLAASESSILEPEALQDLLIDVERQVQKAEMEHALASARLKFAEQTFEKSTNEVRKLPSLQRQVAAMDLDYNQKMKFTELLAEQYINAQMRAKVTFSKLFILEEAALRTDKIGTSKIRMFAMLALVVLGIAVASIVAFDFLRGSIFSKSQLSHNKAHLFLGSVEHISDFGHTNLALKCRQSDSIMRMAYQFAKRHGGDPAEKGRVVAIVSNMSMAGKSFTTLALGVGLSARGHSVCIIDSDFRAKTRNVRGYIDSTKQPITVYANAEELVAHEIGSARADHIAVAPLVNRDAIVDDAQAFLHGRFSTILETLKTRFDYILLDGPPLTFLESLVLVEHASALVVCLPEGSMTKRQFDITLETIEPHRNSSARVFTIMTDCSLTTDRSDHYRQYQEKERAA